MKDEAGKVLCLELVLPEADCDQACCSCSSLCKVVLLKLILLERFLLQDAH